nr:hypothetical protein [Candidatus Njordarchaeota archaeon]
MGNTEFDRYFERIMPLIAAISMMKTFLAEKIAEEVIAKIQKSERRTVTKEQKQAVRTAADAAVARLNPDVFNIDATWAPKSVEDAKTKLIELKLDANFKQALLDEVVRIYREPQSRMHDYKSRGQ